MLEALQFEFMRNALLAGLMASVICAIMGTLVVVHRVVFLSGGIAHASYGGIGLSFFMGWPYLVGTMGFALGAAMLMAIVTLKAKHRADTIIGVMWAVGMATGIVLLDLTPGYHVDLMSYLFGSILTVPPSDLLIMLAVGAIVFVIVGYFYKDLLAMAYDEEFAKARGVPVHQLYFLLITMLALSIVMIIQVIGLILVIALLTIAPYIVEKHTKSLMTMMIWSGFFNIIFTVAGIWIAFHFNITSGAAIILVAGIVFLGDFSYQALKSSRYRPPCQEP
ncbi:MAG: metal ABC transporter permease [Desulfobacteraceae bacterium]|jgi:zinc transport system permease protein